MLKILIISLSGIGNTLLAFPFLRCLRKCYPQAKIDFLVFNHQIEELVRGNQIYGDDVFFLSKRIFDNSSLILELRNKNYDYSVTIFPSNRWQFNVLVFLTGAKIRVSHSYQYRRLLNLSFLQNEKIPAYKGLADVQQNINLLKIFDCECNKEEQQPVLYLDREDVEYAEAFLKQRDLTNEYLIGIHPGGGGLWDKQWQGEAKRWPKDYFAVLCDKLVELKKSKILIFGGKEEYELKNDIKELCIHKKEIFIVDNESLKKNAGLIQKCKLFISNDTCLMHVSTALGIPTLGILGPTDYQRTAPYGRQGYFIRSSIPCSPCFLYPFGATDSKIKCERGLGCLRNITVDDVIDKLKVLGLV